MAIVTVDFDGTLYQGNSFKAMFRAAQKDFGLTEWSIVAVGLAKAIALGITKGKNAFRHAFFKAFAKSFKGKTSKQLDQFFFQLVEIGKKEVNHELVHKIREHQRTGDTIIVLSGALQPFLKAFTNSLELDVYIRSTTLKYDAQGVCTGEIGPLINGDEKVKKVQEFLANEKQQGKDSEYVELWAYADSESDLPLFQFVQHPVVVNPNQAMKEIAKQHNWKIFA
ncbi:HAD family hydrolase [Oceanobacillus halotolerans]|uniref:HAD family hydrolase n=1 Tax=Oceanobacillus halotolerans TaxID=2663380 RepID=UPI0013DCFE0B|nr:HAD family hydrolase [Oceanobacillus halotolerans]